MFKLKIFMIGLGSLALGLFGVILTGYTQCLIPLFMGVILIGCVIVPAIMKRNRDKQLVAQAQQELEIAISNPAPAPRRTTEGTRQLFIPKSGDDV